MTAITATDPRAMLEKLVASTLRGTGAGGRKETVEGTQAATWSAADPTGPA